MKDFGGMPDEILQNEEWLDYFEPILRADFTASENYIHQNGNPLQVPITVITGSEEELELTDIHEWKKESASEVDFRQMPGNHFFIYNNAREIIEIISKKLYVHTKLINYE